MKKYFQKHLTIFENNAFQSFPPYSIVFEVVFTLLGRLTPSDMPCLSVASGWLLLTITILYYSYLSNNQLWVCTKVDEQAACLWASINSDSHYRYLAV